MDSYVSCRLCPRECGTDRTKSKGFCKESASVRLGRAALHMWEEPCISGTKGSGAIFFTGCNMQCVFCQNREISRGLIGKVVTVERLIEIFFELKDQGANNINLVTADIHIPAIAAAIEKARSMNIGIPFLLNTSSYIKAESIKRLDGLIDIYLPDFKYIRDEDSIKYSNAPDYVNTAKAAIDEMIRQRPYCEFRDDTDGQKLLINGVIVRHLLIPGMLIQAKLILNYLFKRYGDRIYISLLNQYTPNKELNDHPEINRKITHNEYKSLIDYALNIGIVNGFIQEGNTADESFIPLFDLRGV